MIAWFADAVPDVPSVFPSPFETVPHAAARRAAAALLSELSSDARYAALHAAGGGKMFGVLVVADASGRIGWLRAFSGMLLGAWDQAGFAPPLFDPIARDAIWPDGQTALRAFELALRAHDAEPSVVADLAAASASDAQLEALRVRHRDRRTARHALRAVGDLTGPQMHALDQASRADAAERRTFDDARAAVLERVAAAAAARAALEQARADESRRLMHLVHDAYSISNALGARVPLRSLYAPGEPPGGAGDCAGPKLLGLAYALGLRPLALAELWFGAPPATGGRLHGSYYPSCRGKCRPLLPYMLGGLSVSPDPSFGGAADSRPLRVLFEDEWLIVVDKPAGLLSVPGRSGALRDAVSTRLGASVVHRLDLDTSGLLVAAKDPATLVAMHRLFALRAIEKRYIALLDGELSGSSGLIDLPLRVDLDDRPRQIVDAVHGKPASTSWRVLSHGSQTRVELSPLTGRTHQLRVHAAHPRGLSTPIVGDRLYGRPAARLMLHATSLSFAHPHTGAAISLASEPPF